MKASPSARQIGTLMLGLMALTLLSGALARMF